MQLHLVAARRIFLATFGLAIAGACSASAAAQALLNLHVGDDISSSVLAARAPEAKDTYNRYWVMKWVLDNGNELSITMTGEGKIVFLESDWKGKSGDTSSDLPWAKFGETTLSEIRKRLGSNGFEFTNRAGAIRVGGGVVMMNSFEIGSNIVTFYTKVSQDDYSKSQAADEKWNVADHARLDGLSVASADYAESEWGDRIDESAEKTIATQ